MQPLESNAGAPTSASIDASFADSGGLTDFLARPVTDSCRGLEPGTRLGDVTVVRLIAEGGMGRVYEGLQGMPCRTVAVKVIRPGVLSAASLKRFEYEAQILGRLTHPGIARIYTMGLEQALAGGMPYFVMEFIDGARPITAYATDHGLSTTDRLKLFREACRAVAHGHQRGVIHRDLKPGNILVDAAGQVKIIDFGVARSIDGDVALTTMHTDAGQLVGTVQYMSPEQFDGASDELDVRADVYALGVVLYELLVGRLPYDVAKQPVYAIARAVKETEPTPIARVNPTLRGDLDTVVLTCLEKDRGRRYSSATELEADLSRYLRGEPIAASPPRLLDSLMRLARRHKVATLLTAGLLTAIVAGGVGASIFAVQATRERETAIREQARADAEATISRQRLYLANLRSLEAAIGMRNLRLGRQLHAENLAIVGAPPPLEMSVLGAGLDEALVVLEWNRGPVENVAYSPDGRILAATGLITEQVPPSAGVLRKSGHSEPLVNSKMSNLLFFAVGAHQEYARLESTDHAWADAWRVRRTGAAAPRDGGNPVTEPLAVCPKSRRIVLYAAEGGARIVNAATDTEGPMLEGFRGRLNAADFSPDGRRLAIIDASRRLGLWDAATGRLVARLGDEGDRIRDFEFSPDGSRIAAVRDGRDLRQDVRLHDAGDGRFLATVTRQRGLGAIDFLLAFSPDGERLVTNFADHQLHVWNVADGAPLGRLAGDGGIVTAIVFSPDGRQIVGGFSNGNIRLWNARSHEVERDLLGHDAAVLSLAVHPDGDTLASGSRDGTVRIWSRSAAGPLAILPDHPGMTAAAFSSDGRRLALAPQRGCAIELWNPHTVERLHALDGPDGLVTGIAFSPDGGLVAAAFKTRAHDGEVRIWATDSGRLLARLEPLTRGAEHVAFSPDGSRLLTTSGAAEAAVWDPRTGHRILSAASDYRGAFADAGAVFGLAGSRVACRMPHLLDATTGEIAARLASHSHVSCLAASPDGRVLAAGMAIGTITVSDFETGRRLARLIGHKAAVRAISFNADGTRIVTGSLDETPRLWDAANGAQIGQLKGHEGAVEKALFSPDGRRILTASRDGTVRIWDTDSGYQLCSLPAPVDFPKAVAVSPDGTLVVTAASARGVRIWGLSNAAVIAARREAASGQ